jgi:hypothetical protein
MKRKILCGALSLLVVWFFAGCSFVTEGRFVTHSQFVYPNSNVKTLGPVVARRFKFTPLVPLEITLKDMTNVYNKALSKRAGANLLVNYTEDTTIVMIYAVFAPLYIVIYQLKGEAAKMEVGQQELL